jgi:hypothetical protein
MFRAGEMENEMQAHWEWFDPCQPEAPDLFLTAQCGEGRKMADERCWCWRMEDGG